MIAKNALVGISSTALTAVVGLAVVPLYLKYLGIEAYGLLGFLTTLLAIVQLLDLGVSSTVSREVAKHSLYSDRDRVAELVHTLARIHWILSPAFAAGLFFLAPLIAGHWIRPEHLQTSTVEGAIKVMAAIIATRLPIGLYQGVLVGKQQMLVMSWVNVGAASASAAGSILLLEFWSPSIEPILGWQALVGLGQAMTLCHFTWRAIGTTSPAKYSIRSLETIWRFSGSMAIIGIMGAILAQTDKLLLSRLLDLASYGKYTLATIIAGSLYVIALPAFNALYPHLVNLAQRGDAPTLIRTYRLATVLLASVIFPMAAFLMTRAEDLLVLWTGDPSLSHATAPLVAILVAGSALHGLMHVPHALQLAHGMTHIPLKINGFLVCVQVPLLIVLTSAYGAIGAASSWLLLHVVYCVLSSWLMYQQSLVGHETGSFTVDVGSRIAISAVVAWLSLFLGEPFSPSSWGHVAIGVGSMVVAILFCLAASPKTLIMMSRRGGELLTKGLAINGTSK